MKDIPRSSSGEITTSSYIPITTGASTTSTNGVPSSTSFPITTGNSAVTSSVQTTGQDLLKGESVGSMTSNMNSIIIGVSVGGKTGTSISDNRICAAWNFHLYYCYSSN